MRLLVLSNPHSTSNRQALFAVIIPCLRKVAELHTVYTQYQGHAEEVVSGLTRQDFDAVIAIGGDGTVNEILSGLLGSDPENRPHPADLPMLGIIPTGSANVFARALGFPNAPAQATQVLVGLLEHGAYRRLPVGRINGRWFCVNAGFGLDAEVINRMEKIRESGGMATPWMYSHVAISTWRKLHKKKPKIHFVAELASGAELAGDVPIAIVSNTNPWTYAGPVPLVTNPTHTIGKGFAFYAVNDLTGPVGLLAMANAMGIPAKPISPRRVDFRETRVDDIASLTLTSDTPLKWQLDGEFGGEDTRLHLVSTPEAIDVLSPQTRALL